MLKFIIYAVLAYLLLRAVVNLLAAMSGGTVRSGPGSRSGGSANGQASRIEEKRATRLRDEEDIEDARWEDL